MEKRIIRVGDRISVWFCNDFAPGHRLWWFNIGRHGVRLTQDHRFQRSGVTLFLGPVQIEYWSRWRATDFMEGAN